MAVRRLWVVTVVALVASLMVAVVGGEATAELSTSTVTVDSGVVNIPVPTGAPGTTSGPVTPSPTLAVAQSGRVADVDVGIRVDHTFYGDLHIWLTSPDGTTLDLVTSNTLGLGSDYGTAADCSSTAGLTVFDDAAATSVTPGGEPFEGSFEPEMALAGLEGESAAGTWVLGIDDELTGDIGTLICWTLVLTYAGPLAGADVCNQLGWSGFDGTTSQIWVANADGTGRAEIVTPGSGTDPTLNFDPMWSPDGSRIAFQGHDGTTEQIWIADPDGTNRVEISSVGSGIDPIGNVRPAWSSDGARVAWDGWLVGSSPAIWAADADGAKRLAISRVGPGPVSSTESAAAWSPDGSQIAWSGDDGTTFQIWVADADGTNRHEISTVGAGTDPTSNRDPVWSPDGSRVIWPGFDGTTGQIWVANSDGSNRGLISTVAAGPDPIENRNPVWSPDGTRVAWSGHDGTTNQIWVADPDGTNRVSISDVSGGTDPIVNLRPTWSPDGRRLAWQGWDGAVSQIYVANVDGTAREEISSVELGPDPISNSGVDWRNRYSHFDLTTAVTGLKDGQTATATATVTNTGPCPSSNIVVTGLSLPCVSSAEAAITAGSVTDSTWSIPALAPGAAVTATLTGTVTGTGACGSTLAVTALPATAGPVTASLGGTLVACPTAAPPFTDVPATSFAVAHIACIYGLEITTGTSATTYSPFDFVTREQMAAFLARLWRVLSQTCPTGPTPFTDVSPTSFAVADIACIYGLGVTTGTSDTTYSPFDNVTREQMAAFLARLWRALGEACSTTGPPFTDVLPTSFAVADIACIYGLGITTGTSLTTYSPFDFVTREQMAAFLARLWRVA